jgi:hypothetical protein
MTNSYLEREVPTGVKEEHDDVNEANILGLTDDEYFHLKVILFVIVSDSPAACNLSGQSKKICYRCPHYFSETDSQYLSET